MRFKIFFALICIAVSIQCVSVYAINNVPGNDWFVYDVPDTDKISGTALDASYLLDKPAGKHGFLRNTDGDNYVFEDGETVRFWGICLSDSDAIPEYEDSVLLAKRFAQLGYNIVRFISEEGEIFSGKKADGSRAVNSDKMDKLCFFMNELKKHGIYYMLDVNCGISYTVDDNLPDVENTPRSYSVYGYFDRQLIQIQKDNLKKLLCYRNPYSGMSLVDDPALVFVNLRNENSVITAAALDASDYYNLNLQNDFNLWLQNKYGSTDNIKNAWTPAKYKYDAFEPLTETEELGSIGVPNFITRRTSQAKLRAIDTNEFLNKLHTDYFAEMTNYLRNDLGLKCLVSGTTMHDNSGFSLMNAYSNKSSDHIETHHYKGRVAGSKYLLYSSDNGNVTSEGLNEIPYSIMDKTEGSNILVAEELFQNGYAFPTNVMSRNIHNMPHMVSEWNYSSGYPYKSEGLLIMSAYASMHNSNMIMFDWGMNNISEYSSDNMMMDEQYSTYNQPNYISALPAASAIFLRGDATVADKGFYYERYRGCEPLNADFMRNSPGTTNFDRLKFLRSLKIFSHQSALIGRTGMTFDDFENFNDNINSNDVLYLTKKFNESGKYLSVTGEILFDTNDKVFTLNTPKAQAVSGYLGNKTQELDDVIFDIDNEFATVYLTSVGNEEIFQSERILLTTVGHQLNTNQEMDENNQKFVDGKIGEAPILVEPVTGNVVIKTGDDITIYALDNSGQRKSTVICTDNEKGKTFALQNGVMNYEIVKNTNSSGQNTHIELGDLTVNNLFADVGNNHTDKIAIERAVLLGLMDGKTETEFKPDDAVTRREFISMIVDGLNLYTRADDGSRYNDISSSDDAYRQATIAKNIGILDYYPGNNLYPENNVSREEMIAITAEALLASDAGNDFVGKYDSTEYETMLTTAGYIDSNMADNGILTRAEAARLIYNLMWK